MADAAPRALLPPLERRLLLLLATGTTERDAARELSYSYSYVRLLAAQAAARLGVSSTREAIYRASKLGLI